jgi:RND family efflux transporter MFP subunit
MRPRSLAIVLTTLVAACAPSAAPAPSASRDSATQTPREVRVAAIEEVAWERALRVTGELAEYESATLSTKVPGRVASIGVDLGSRIAKGAPIAEIEPRDYELRVTQAEAALSAARALLGLADEAGGDRIEPAETALVRKAQAELDDARRENQRLVELQKSGVSAQSELDKSVSRLAQAESALQDARESVQNRLALVAQRRAELAIAKQQLADTRILSPFDGVVAERSVGTGDYLTAGAAVATLVRDDPLRLRLAVREVDAPLVRIEQVVRITLDGFDAPLEARIVRLAPAIDPRTRSLIVECELPNADGRLRAGSFARAEIVVDPTARSLAVPIEALISFAGIDKVIAVVDGKAKETRVVVGRRDERRVELVSGLEAGAVVVLAPGGLQTGTPLVIAK